MAPSSRKNSPAIASTLRDFLDHLDDLLPRNPRTAVFMARDPEGVPTARLHNFKHNGVLYDHILHLTVQSLESPDGPKPLTASCSLDRPTTGKLRKAVRCLSAATSRPNDRTALQLTPERLKA